MKDAIQKRKDSGFTIVEVMIVLAIAGLIILVVFLAVPALQRNSRNTQRKADVSSILGAVNDYKANHNGKNPDSTTFPVVKNNLNPGYYDTAAASGAGSITLAAGAQPAITPLDTTGDKVVVVTGAKCSTTTSGATVVGPSRATAVQYLVESNGSYEAMCQEG